MATNKGKIRFEILYGKNGQGYGLFRRFFREGKKSAARDRCSFAP
jgi:hypothetical protein